MSTDHDGGEDDSSNAVPDEESVVHVVENGRPDFFRWSHKATRLLLELRLGRDAEFQQPTCRKIKLWEQISDSMADAGFLVSGHACDSKYRNLLITYRKNKIKVLTNESSRVSWEFYEFFDSYLGDRYDAAPETTPSSPPTEFEISHEEPIFDLSDFEGRYVIRQATSSNKRFKASDSTMSGSDHDERPHMSIQEYFYEKMRFDRECHSEDSKMKARQLDIQERKLKLAENRIELEKAKVEALTALATALSGIKSVVK